MYYEHLFDKTTPGGFFWNWVKTINNNIYKKKMLKNIIILEYYVGDTEIIFGYNLKAPLNV